jgi:hypothetical protein
MNAPVHVYTRANALKQLTARHLGSVRVENKRTQSFLLTQWWSACLMQHGSSGAMVRRSDSIPGHLSY